MSEFFPKNLTEKNIEKWLKKLFRKLKRETSRTSVCRLLLSVDRYVFQNYEFARQWRKVKFFDSTWSVYDEKEQLLQEMDLTKVQQIILEKKPELRNVLFDRWEIKAETGLWNLDELKGSDLPIRGGEAIVLFDDINESSYAIRIQLFDSAPFTSSLQVNELSYKINLAKSNNFNYFTKIDFKITIRCLL